MGKRVREFSVIILEDSGGYLAVVPELPGCHTQGDTVDEALENIREAVELYLETLPGEGGAAKPQGRRRSESEGRCLE